MIGIDWKNLQQVDRSTGRQVDGSGDVDDMADDMDLLEELATD